MPSGSTPLANRAREIFSDLGYAVSGDGREFSATRMWREVTVTAVTERLETPSGGTYRCFVTWKDDVAAVRRRLDAADPDYEWAVIGVSEDGYEVA